MPMAFHTCSKITASCTLVATHCKTRPYKNVKDLVLQQIADLKEGNFDEDLIIATINNLKVQRVQEQEKHHEHGLCDQRPFCHRQRVGKPTSETSIA